MKAKISSGFNGLSVKELEVLIKDSVRSGLESAASQIAEVGYDDPETLSERATVLRRRFDRLAEKILLLNLPHAYADVRLLRSLLETYAYMMSLTLVAVQPKKCPLSEHVASVALQSAERVSTGTMRDFLDWSALPEDPKERKTLFTEIRICFHDALSQNIQLVSRPW